MVGKVNACLALHFFYWPLRNCFIWCLICFKSLAYLPTRSFTSALSFFSFMNSPYLHHLISRLLIVFIEWFSSCLFVVALFFTYVRYIIIIWFFFLFFSVFNVNLICCHVQQTAHIYKCTHDYKRPYNIEIHSRWKDWRCILDLSIHANESLQTGSVNPCICNKHQ